MGFVISDIIEIYKKNLEITIISNSQNLHAMKNLSGVNNVITYSGNNFEYYSTLKKEINEFSKQYYELAIIPTNGNIETYDNIYHFTSKYFSCKEIKYYVYPKKLITKEKIGIRKTIKKLFKILTNMVCLPLTIILIFIFYVIAFLKK